MAKQDEESKQPLPPYLPFKTFAGFIQRLKGTAVPERIDSSVLRSYSGSSGRQLIAALKFLGLIEEGGSITHQLPILVNAYGAPSWQEVFGNLLRDAYQGVIGDLRVEIATRAQLDERFRSRGADGEVLQKCVAFYVAAMQSAEAKVSPFILERSRPGRPRGSGGRSRTKRERQNGGIETEEETPSVQPGTVRFAFPIPDKLPVTMFLPADLSIEDWQMVDAMIQAYIRRREKGK